MRRSVIKRGQRQKLRGSVIKRVHLKKVCRLEKRKQNNWMTSDLVIKKIMSVRLKEVSKLRR